jgi:hypothetical protein
MTTRETAAPACIVRGCGERAVADDSTLEDYCAAHADEWLTAEASIERREEAA